MPKAVSRTPSRHSRRSLSPPPVSRVPSRQSSRRPSPAPVARRTKTLASNAAWVTWLCAHFEANEKEYIEAIKHDSAEAFDDLVRALIKTLPPDTPLPPTKTPNAFSEWGIGTLGRHREAYPTLAPALAERRKANKARHQAQSRLAANVLMYKRPTHFAALAGAAHIQVEKLKVPYPPPAHWIANSQRIFDKWESYLRVCEQPDKRLPRHPIHLLDPSRIVRQIPADLECFIYDKDTNDLIAVVIRKFCGIATIKEWVKRLVFAAAIERRSIRLEDPGQLIQVAFSGGSRSAPAFGMVRNFLWQTDSAEQMEKSIELATLFSYMWLRVKAQFPPEVVKDFEDFYDKWNIPRFDPDWPTSYAREADLNLPLGSGKFKLSDVERGPGLGVLSRAYARAMHYEKQGHLWAISWMANRWGSDVRGGHFYLGDYGTEILMDDDTCWGWKPEAWHCTGLSNYDPTFDIPQLEDPNHNQQGVAFVSSARLPQIYAKWEAAHGVSGRDKVLNALNELNGTGCNSDSEEMYE